MQTPKRVIMGAFPPSRTRLTSCTLFRNQVTEFDSQITIVGGGIAGLWLLNRLCLAGYDAILLDKGGLGSGQTLASQGIIHGGLKYALNGILNPASSAIADMPERWRACLQGLGEIDLRATRLLSPSYYMWSGGSMRSRFKSFLGSKALRGRIDTVQPTDYPIFFEEATENNIRGTLYRLPDFVVDTPSLLETLASPWMDRIFSCRDVFLEGDRLVIKSQGANIRIRSDKTILCAGEGNEALLSGLSHPAKKKAPAMQRRPLHMVAVQLAHPFPVYVHCIGDRFGMTPRLTVTSHPCPQDRKRPWIWYLGGELAETGVNLEPAEQHEKARKLLTTMFPWVNLEDAQWESIIVNRAEPKVADLSRPDNAFVSDLGKVMVCWPTKLTLCPNLGDTVLAQIEKEFPPSQLICKPGLTPYLSQARLALPKWENLLS